MLNFALAVAAKDLRIVFAGPGVLLQGLLLGLLIIFLFSLSKGAGEITSAREAATIFWLASVFFQLIAFSQLYAIEETNLGRQALALAPAPVQGVWLGKACAGILLLLCAQAVFLPGSIIFLGQNIAGPLWPGAMAVCMGDIGIGAAGSLLGAAAQGQGGRESLLGIILLPLLAPLLLAAISLGSISLSAENTIAADGWPGVGFAFDAIFIGCGFALFGFLYRGNG